MNELNRGHRSRLREKFFNNGLDGFLDYEVVELLLILGTPRKDCKPMAKDLIRRFGNLNNVLDASTDTLTKSKGVGTSNIVAIKLFQEITERYHKNKTEENKQILLTKDLANYLIERIGKQKKEHFAILYMDTKNKLVFDDVSVGILNASLVHPREVFSKAVSEGISHIVISHNHPSGDVSPSTDDFLTTKRLVEAGKILGILVVDHIIVSRNSFYSFREMGKLLT